MLTSSDEGKIRLPFAWMASILLLALLLRAIGVDFGLPFWLVNDELPLVGGAMRMLELRNPIPSLNPGPMAILYYPVGLPWLYMVVWAPILMVKWALAGFPPLQFFADRLLSDFSALWVSARVISVVASAGLVLVIMRLAAEIFRDRIASLLAGLFMATSFHHAMLGHFARVWPMTLLLWWFGLWAAYRIYRVGRQRDYLWGGLAAGFGFIVNYVVVLVAVAVGTAHLARHRWIVVNRPVLLHVVIVAAFIVFGLVTSWPSFLRLLGYSSLLRDTFVESAPQATPSFFHLLGFYATVALRADFLLVLTGLLALPILARAAPIFIVIFVAAMAPYVLLVLTGYANDDRYVLPITPLFALAAGGFATLRRPALRKVAIGLATIVIAAQAALLLQLDQLMLRPDTRQVARSWIDDNVPSGEGVINAMRGVMFEQTTKSITLERDLAPGSITYLQRRRLAGANVASGDGGLPREAIQLRVTGAEMLRAHGAEWVLDRLVREGYRWYVVDDLTGPLLDGRFEELIGPRLRLVHRIEPGPPGILPPIFNLTNQFERGTLFDVFRVRHLGPKVEIYQLQ